MPHFAFGLTELSGYPSGAGLILAWNRYDIESIEIDDHPDGVGLYATTGAVVADHHIFVSSRSPIAIPEENCPVDPDGFQDDRNDLDQRGLTIDFHCIPEGTPRLSAAVVLDFYEGESLAYSARPGGALKTELVAHGRVHPPGIVIRSRLKKLPFCGEIDGLSPFRARVLTARDVWESLMTSWQ